MSKLLRKKRRIKVRSKQRVQRMQSLNSKPVIKNIDIEEIKRSFGTLPPKEEAPAEA